MEKLPLVDRVASVARFIGHLIGPNQLASHGDHFVRDPEELVEVLPPRVEQPSLWDDMGNYYEGDLDSLTDRKE